ncbi:disease resistance RPP13-like protein 4 [Magnolia sinica]|uniref:disease resistance RPP13-like protein 4 n=1 Tax=Magnolia sinica TaxID=86752 RepID=UPI00265A2A7E|nr:disease resistance RPP13-like protein 4 [Magnolia sinica]
MAAWPFPFSSSLRLIAEGNFHLLLSTSSLFVQRPTSIFLLQALYSFREMADAIVSVLLDRLVSLLVSEGHQLLGFDSQFEETKKELQYMQSFLEEVNRVRRKDRGTILKMVMSELREMVYDAEDVIADCQLLSQKTYQGYAANFMNRCSPTLFNSRRRMGKLLRKINQEVRKVRERMIAYMGTVPHLTNKEDSGNRSLTYSILIDEAEMVGLENDSAKIRKWILEANEPLVVIGIVGMKGIGKTAVAQKICNSEGVKNSFKHSFLVTVSQSIKFDELIKKMLKKLNIEEESLMGKDINELLERLKSELHGKYLIVLDDVREMDEMMWWERLKSTLPRVSGSCIIVTTRKEQVAKSMGATDKCIHHPKTLSNEDSWSLFSKVAFARNGGKCTNSELEHLGKEIVTRCEGLPLTINVLGRMMLRKGDSIHEWKRISEQLKEESAISKKEELVISCLELCYEELLTHLKPCLLCLAMLPEGFEITVTEMVNLWIGEGFVWGRNGKTAFEIGEEYLTELINQFFILGQEKDVFERRFITCKMHDMVQDMVIKIAREERLFVGLDGDGQRGSSVQPLCLGISMNTTVDSVENSSTKLRSLVGKGVERKEIIASVKAKLHVVRWLRVLSLSLSRTGFDEDVVASGIGSLNHLTYLNIQGSSALRSLPDSIANLRNLQILCLYDCPNLEWLPVSITTLEKLTAIEIAGCESLECMPEGLGQLSNLERLFGFRPVKSGRKNGSGISQLKNLTRLKELIIEINSDERIEEGDWNVLSMLQHLQFLVLDCKGCSLESDGVARKIDCRLSTPLKSLTELHLRYYPGEITPAWLSPTSLPNLQFLFIYGGRIRQMGPRFWVSENEVWKVEVLVLQNLEVMDDERRRMRRAMPSLRLLKVYKCPKLKSFPLDVTIDEGAYSIWRKEDEEEEERKRKSEMEEAKGLTKYVFVMKFKDGTPQDKIEELIRVYAKLVSLIKPMKSFLWGTDVSGKYFSEGFTHAFESTFESEEGFQEFLSHPAHVKFLEARRPALDKHIYMIYKPAQVIT